MAETLVDQPGEVRAEDKFDTGAVHEWLSSQVDGLVGLPEVRQFPGGASNLTYLLRYPDRELILRRPPTGRSWRCTRNSRFMSCAEAAFRPTGGRRRISSRSGYRSR